MSAPTPIDAVPINASFGRTWDEVMDYLIEINFSARVIDRSSGFFQSIPMRYVARGPLPTPTDARFRGTATRPAGIRTAAELLAAQEIPRDADCGGDSMNGRYAITDMRLDIHVWGDSSTSRVRVSPLFFSDNVQCSTRGALEKDIVDRVRSRAEGGRSVVAPVAPIRVEPSLPATPTAAAAEGPFVGSRVDQVFYRSTCAAAQELAATNRRYFRTEQEAIAAGYRRSRVTGC